MRNETYAVTCVALLWAAHEARSQSILQILPESIRKEDTAAGRGASASYRKPSGEEMAPSVYGDSSRSGAFPRVVQHLEPMGVSVELPLEDIQEGILFVPSLVGTYYKAFRFLEFQCRVASQAPAPASDFERTASRIIARGGVGNIGSGLALKWSSERNNPGMLAGVDAGTAWQSRMEMNDTTIVPFFFFSSYGLYMTSWFGPLAVSFERRFYDVIGPPSDRVSRLVNGSWSNALTAALHIHPETDLSTYMFIIRLSKPDFIGPITEDNFEFRLVASRMIGFKI